MTHHRSGLTEGVYGPRSVTIVCEPSEGRREIRRMVSCSTDAELVERARLEARDLYPGWRLVEVVVHEHGGDRSIDPVVVGEQ